MSATRVTVKAKPRAKKSAILRASGLSIDVALAAPPVDGAANVELVAVVASALGVPKRDVSLVMGASSRTKVVEVAGLDAAETSSRLAAAVHVDRSAY